MIGTHSDITERMEQRDWLERQVLERTAQLRAMAVDLTAAEERERHSVAQDLHDGLGQILAVAKLKHSALDFRQQPESSGKSLPQEVKEIEALLGQANHTMRSLSLQLSPPVLRELDLLAALHWLADEVERSFGLRVNLSDDGSPKPLDENMLKVVFRAARELLINAAKHSQADAVDVEALCEDGHLVLSVADTGVGFSLRSVPPPSARGGYGLFSVRDRLGFIGGTVQIDSSPGNGTVVVIRVPLGTRHHDDCIVRVN
jgi:signal transduction histidine kinase